MIDNISLYTSFVVVADCGSLSAAARSLYISQPALSAEIQQLEAKLNTKLFFRTSRGMNLTEEGRLIYEYVSSALSFISAGEEKLKDVLGLRSGLLRIGAGDTALRFCLLDYIVRFRAIYPDVKLKVTDMSTPVTISAIRSGNIDFGVLSSADDLVVSCDDLQLVEARVIKDIFVCSPGLEIANKKSITVEMLNEYPLIMLDGQTSSRQYIYSRIGDKLKSPDIELSSGSLITEFARRGVGIAPVVEDFASEYIERGELVKLDLANTLPPRAMYIAYLKKQPLTAAARRMIEIIKQK